MIITLLGTGTSHGIPVIGCHCPCCTSSDPKDNRLRASIKIQGNDGSIFVVDTGPEFRLQAIKYHVETLNALFLTHSHADHLHGLDDVRIYSHTRSSDSIDNTSTNILPIYANSNTIIDMKERFSYVFKETQIGGGKPLLNIINCEQFTKSNPLKINNFSIIPIPMTHGKITTSGWLFSENGTKQTFAYLTDCNYIPDSSIELCKNVDYLIIDGLREAPHSTHLNFEQAIDYSIKMNAKYTFLTHITHRNKHSESKTILENICKNKSNTNNVELAWDGLQLFLD